MRWRWRRRLLHRAGEGFCQFRAFSRQPRRQSGCSGQGNRLHCLNDTYIEKRTSGNSRAADGVGLRKPLHYTHGRFRHPLLSWLHAVTCCFACGNGGNRRLAGGTDRLAGLERGLGGAAVLDEGGGLAAAATVGLAGLGFTTRLWLWPWSTDRAPASCLDFSQSQSQVDLPTRLLNHSAPLCDCAVHTHIHTHAPTVIGQGATGTHRLCLESFLLDPLAILSRPWRHGTANACDAACANAASRSTNTDDATATLQAGRQAA